MLLLTFLHSMTLVDVVLRGEGLLADLCHGHMHSFLHVRHVFVLPTIDYFRELLVSQEWLRILFEAHHRLEGLIISVNAATLQT